jgi:uncharacterized membrane protein YphA (DoxX/SURF4 family)
VHHAAATSEAPRAPRAFSVSLRGLGCGSLARPLGCPHGGRVLTAIPLRRAESAAEPRPARGLGWWVGTLAGAFLGAVLLVAVWAKAIDPAAFAEQIHGEGLDRLLPAGAMALLALMLEAGIGLALLLGVRRLWVLVPALLLVAFFVSLTGRSYWLAAHGIKDSAANCGCFGNLVQRSPAAAFWQDALMLVPAALLAWSGRPRGGRAFPPWRTAIVAAFAVAVVVFAWRAPALPLDDLATRLRPGAEVKKLCAGGAPEAGSATGAGAGESVCLDSVAPELGDPKGGDHLVVLADLDDPAFGRAVAAFNRYAGSPGAAQVWVLTASSAARRRAFFWKWAPAFKIAEAPPELLRPLYRRLPRSFRVHGGRVTETFAGLPPALRDPGSPRTPA